MLYGLDRFEVENVSVAVRLAIFFKPLELLMGLLVGLEEVGEAVDIRIRHLNILLLYLDNIQLFFEAFELTLRFLIL